jgi:uncharacterized membrane protein YesL
MCFLPFLLLAYDYNFPASLHAFPVFSFLLVLVFSSSFDQISVFSFLHYFEQRAHGGRLAFPLLASRSVPKETFLVSKGNGFGTLLPYQTRGLACGVGASMQHFCHVTVVTDSLCVLCIDTLQFFAGQGGFTQRNPTPTC